MMMQRTYITTGERIRTYLAIAFVLSLALNAISTLIFPYLRAPVQERNPPRIIHIQHLKLQTPRPTPQPTPPPKARRPRRMQRAAHPFVPRLPRTRAVFAGAPLQAMPTLGPGTAGGEPGAGPTTQDASQPAVATPAAPSCADPNADATVTNVATPDYPDSARDLQLGNVSVLVKVTLDARGALVGATIAQSSGNLAVDDAALRAARQSTYAPRIVNCVPSAGSYIFRADFQT